MDDPDRRHAELLARLDRQTDYLRAVHRALGVLQLLAVIALAAWLVRAFG